MALTRWTYENDKWEYLSEEEMNKPKESRPGRFIVGQIHPVVERRDKGFYVQTHNTKLMSWEEAKDWAIKNGGPCAILQVIGEYKPQPLEWHYDMEGLE